MSRDSPARPELLTRLNRELQRGSDHAVLFNQAVALRVGIHPTDLKVLSLLYQDGPLTAGQLAGLTGLSTGGITFMIDRLEKAGYVQRAPHPHDRRSVLVELQREQTLRDTGRFFAAMGQAVDTLAASYTDEELAVILDFITRSNEVAKRETARVREDVTVKAT